MSVTLEKIGYLTGTSAATVSRALRGSGRVSAQTRARILTVAEQFNYRPNYAARSMVNRSTQLIGVVLPASGSAPFSRVLGGVESVARQAGYSVVFCQTEDDREFLHEHLKLLGCRRVDGVLFCPDRNSLTSLACLDQLGPVGSRPPIVIVQEPIDQAEYASVSVDNSGGTRLLCEHLIGHGHRDIGFLHMDSSRAIDERFDGCRRAMEQAGEMPGRVQRVAVRLHPGTLSEDPYGYIDCDWLDATLAAHPQWTALMVASDILAVKVIQALKMIGRRVPDDLAVVGFDDVLVSAFVDPPLTTARQPSVEVGQTACRLLLDMIAGEHAGAPKAIRLPCTLRVRQSCGCRPE